MKDWIPLSPKVITMWTTLHIAKQNANGAGADADEAAEWRWECQQKQ